jgi:predicted nucleic acid-binding protein
MSIAVDTSVWIDYYRNAESRHARMLNKALATQRIIVPDVVVLETLRGVMSEPVAEALAIEFEKYRIVQTGGAEPVFQAAKNYRILRGLGITIRSTIDLMIGTWCIENSVPLLHNDRDFDQMQQGLGLMCVPVDETQ